MEIDFICNEFVKTLEINEKFITCLTCIDKLPFFCQYKKMDIDPRDVQGNEERAKKCEHWWPHGISRSYKK